MLSAIKRSLRSSLSRSASGARVMLWYHTLRRWRLSRLSDEEFAQRSHMRSVGTALDLTDPCTFDERQWWLKLNYRNPLMIQCTDKIAVRDYVEGAGLAHILPPLVAVYDRPSDIDWATLPSRFYMKTNHSSATNIRCNDLSSFDTRRAEALLKIHLKRNHYGLSREWNYRDITPRILVEPIIETSGQEGLIDYRFLCSYGECKGIIVGLDTADESGGHRDDARRNLYDRDWNLLEVDVNSARMEERELEKPALLSEMIAIAEALSAPFPFCRIDLYHPTSDRILFGEITFFNFGANNRISPEEYQLVLGSWIDLERAKREMDALGEAGGLAS